MTLDKLVILLSLYTNAALAYTIHRPGNKWKFIRDFLKSKYQEYSWLPGYCSRGLKIDSKSFSKEYEKDLLRLAGIAKLLYVISATVDRKSSAMYRIEGLCAQLNKFLAGSFNSNPEIKIPTEIQHVYEKSGFYCVLKEEVSKIEALPCENTPYTVSLTFMANKPYIHFQILDYIAAYGYLFSAPDYEKGKFHKIQLTVDTTNQDYLTLLALGDEHYAKGELDELNKVAAQS